MMISVFIGTSVDGFIARKDGALDFLPDDDVDHGYEAFVAGIDTFVIGRNTFETVLGFPAWPFGEKRVVVLSHRPVSSPTATGGVVEHLSGRPAEIVAELERTGSRSLYLDGGLTIQEFLRAGLVDRLIITRVPVLIGEGIPLFGSLPHDVLLRAVRTTQFSNGFVQTEYHVEAR